MNFNIHNFYLERQGSFKIKNKHKNIRLDDRGSVITFGREKFSNVVLYNRRCNLHHCEIIFDDDGRIFIKDLGGSAGTYVNTEKISNTQKEIFANDLIGMGFNPFKARHRSDPVGYIYKVKKFETITLDSDSDDSDIEIIQEQVVPQNVNDDSKSNDEEFDKDEEDVEENQIFDFPSISQNNEENSVSSEKSKDSNKNDTEACENVLNRLWCSDRRQSILMFQNFQVGEENYQRLRENEEITQNLVQNPGIETSKKSAIDEETHNLSELKNLNSNSEATKDQTSSSGQNSSSSLTHQTVQNILEYSPIDLTPKKIKERETTLRHCNIQTTKFIEDLPDTNSDESLLDPIPTPPQKPKRGRKKKVVPDANKDQSCKRTVQTTKAVKSFKSKDEPEKEMTESSELPSVSSKRKQSQEDLNQNKDESDSSKKIKLSSIQTRRKSILKCSGLESSTDQNSKTTELAKRRKSVSFDLQPSTSGYKPKTQAENKTLVVQPQMTNTSTPNERRTQNLEFPSTSANVEPQPSTSGSNFDSKIPPRRISLFNNKPSPNLGFPSHGPSTLNVEPQPLTSNSVLMRRMSIFEEKKIYSNLSLKEREKTLKHWKQPTTKLIDEPIPIGRMRKSVKPVVTKVPAKRGRKKIEPQVEQTEEQKKLERIREMCREKPKRKRGPNKKKGNGG